VADVAELEKLSSKELHDRAMQRARRHLDLGFFWRVLEAIPAAEAVAGREGEAQQDVLSLTERINDFFQADEGALADALRPLYIEYLAEHDDD
jgi:hypothetical protein